MDRHYLIHTYTDIDGNQQTERVYDMDFLMHGEITPDVVDDLYENASLYLSIVVGMFKFMGYSDDTDEILKICTTESDYMYKYKWTAEQRLAYEDMIRQAMKHALGASDDKIEHELSSFSLYGGAFTVSDYENLTTYN